MSFRAVQSMVPMAGEHIRLRRPRDFDAETIAEYLRDADADEWLSGSGNAQALYAEYSAGWNAPDEPNRLGLTLIIARGASDALTGVAHVEPDHRVLHVSYGVAPEHRRRGVASDALTLISAWALSHGFDRVELEIGEDNAGSQAVARRCGFTPTSRVRSQVLPDGQKWHARAWSLESRST